MCGILNEFSIWEATKANQLQKQLLLLRKVNAIIILFLIFPGMEDAPPHVSLTQLGFCDYPKI